jgi:zinc finger-containing ubiquitin peptidase 1
MLSLNIPCTGTAFNGDNAWLRLLDFVENYFANSTAESQSRGRVAMTSRPPIFLQRPGHSVVIVGVVKLNSGKRRLLIFDPAWRPPAGILEASSEGANLSWKEVLDLRRYSKSERWLQRFSAFETLTIDMGSLPESHYHQDRQGAQYCD